jgi:hypothetical protein
VWGSGWIMYDMYDNMHDDGDDDDDAAEDDDDDG